MRGSLSSSSNPAAASRAAAMAPHSDAASDSGSEQDSMHFYIRRNPVQGNSASVGADPSASSSNLPYFPPESDEDSELLNARRSRVGSYIAFPPGLFRNITPSLRSNFEPYLSDTTSHSNNIRR